MKNWVDFVKFAHIRQKERKGKVPFFLWTNNGWCRNFRVGEVLDIKIVSSIKEDLDLQKTSIKVFFSYVYIRMIMSICSAEPSAIITSITSFMVCTRYIEPLFIWICISCQKWLQACCFYLRPHVSFVGNIHRTEVFSPNLTGRQKGQVCWAPLGRLATLIQVLYTKRKSKMLEGGEFSWIYLILGGKRVFFTSIKQMLFQMLIGLCQ